MYHPTVSRGETVYGVVKVIDDPKLREITEQLEQARASIRAVVEPQFRVL